ncbi:baseplate protein [Actinoplanes ianthinogenes]|uniref:Baseplate protein n=1 Tax=Actinoplanes ianthinogenes TaxID=122358 RepID=A0ABN6C334_9ACTN|nr:GPW/gp25 family protein [Actinoplanes ianthinogenes]BCJ39854.1 baseplate protein [Actinoplanes ianthinogenes]GGR08599.1 baseplate protein [Actinoplanes ianthinogenes]
MSRDFLGRGWRFPPQIDERGRIAMSAAEDDIREAIGIVIGTAPGERPMQPDFGCGAHDYVFAPASALGELAYQVREALTRWEPRIDVLDVALSGDPRRDDAVLIRVDYRIRAHNTVHNLVYPLYTTEGGA